eukprot:jgi/Mesvir1/18278/Mv09543-RA.2
MTAASRYGLVHSAWSTLEHVAVLAFGFMPWLWDLSAAVLVRFGFDVASNEILQTIIFLAVYNTIGQVMGLPWSIFHTFVLEEKHGFNKQTPWLFFMDMVKSNLLTAIIGPPVIAAIIAIVQRTGPLFPLYLWLFLFIFALVMMTVYPTLIQPLFNKFSPLPEGKLREDIEALAARLKFPLKKLFVIDGSKRSSHSNAYMFGFFKNKRIVLFDTLVNQSTPEQVVAVIAHELGHWKLNHTLFNFVTMQVLLLVQLGGYSLFRTYSDVFTSFGFSLGNGVQHPVLIGLLLYNYMLSPVDHLIHFGQNLLSRRFEFQADAFAKDLGYCESLCSGLVKLQEENLSSMDSDPLYSAYHYSHPPLIERLSALCGPGQSIADLATKKDQ